MNTKLNELKVIVMNLAADLKECKLGTKEYQVKHGGNCGGRQWALQCKKSEYRSYHIAYSMLLGNEYQEIEKSRHIETDAPNWSKINKIKEQYEKTVCVDAA